MFDLIAMQILRTYLGTLNRLFFCYFFMFFFVLLGSINLQSAFIILTDNIDGSLLVDFFMHPTLG